MERLYGDARSRTVRGYNMHLFDNLETTGDFWQMPIIKKDNFIPSDLISFNYCINKKPQNETIHFFIDDYQFERVWRDPERYLKTAKRYGSILTPDFSLYADMNINQQIYNVYRSRTIGAYYQTNGVKVIPTISWGLPKSFKFCFKGVEEGSIVAVSSVGVMRNKLSLFLFNRGFNQMIEEIKPSAIIWYGAKIQPIINEYNQIKFVFFENRNSKWRVDDD